AAAGGKIDGSEQLAAGVDLDNSLRTAYGEKFFDEPHRLENLEREGMNDGGAIPVERRGLSVNQMTLHAAAVKLRCKEQASRAGTDDEYGNLAGCNVRIVLLRQSVGMVGGICHRGPLFYRSAEASGRPSYLAWGWVETGNPLYRYHKGAGGRGRV